MRWLVIASLPAWATPALAGHELKGRDIAAGAALYATHCAACHGSDLEGAPDWQIRGPDGVFPAPPHDETGHTWHHSNEQLFEYTKLGGQALVARMGLTNFTSGMPGFGGVLSDDQIWQVLAFIASNWPEEQAAIQAARNPPH
jgi:mono/diheme cytochrome c family protein